MTSPRTRACLLISGFLAALTSPVALANPSQYQEPAEGVEKDRTEPAFLSSSRAPSLEKEALQSLLAIENARDASHPFLKEALESSSARVVRQAALVLGRIGEASSEPLLVAALNHADAGVRQSAAFSLGLLGSGTPTARTAFLNALAVEADARVRQALWVGLGRVATRDDFAQLSEAFIATRGREKAGAAEGLVQLWQRERTGWGPQDVLFGAAVDAVLSNDDETGLVNEAAAVILARFRGDRSLGQLQPLVSVVKEGRNAVARMLAVRSLGGIKAPETVEVLTSLFATSTKADGALPPPLRVEVALAAGRQEWSPALEILFEALLGDRNARVGVQTLESLATFGAKAARLAAGVAQIVEEPSRTLQEHKLGLRALVSLDPIRAKSLAAPYLEKISAAADLGLEALSARDRALGLESLAVDAKLGAADAPALAAEAAQKTMGLLLSSDVTLRAHAAENLALFPADVLAATPRLTEFIAQGLRSHDFRVTCHLAEVIGVVASEPTAAGIARLQALTGDVVAAWEFYRAPGESDGRLCLLGAMESLGSLADVEKAPLIARAKEALTDPVAQVAMQAAESYEALTGSQSETEPTAQTKAQVATPSAREVADAVSSTVVLTTTRGEVHMRMLSIAPLTAVNIVRLARKGFYDGLTFHRVIPNFVSQGGDPRGDGWGGPGFLMRDEVSMVSHAAGTVGIATSGKDTGGSQFFVNETHNFHLNGVYTVFARVTRGLSVVRKLTEGDIILHAKVVP
jgi:cyclophilin family peptidyl-prolyl cis-trans isomerase